jgi:hypothetical protein
MYKIVTSPLLMLASAEAYCAIEMSANRDSFYVPDLSYYNVGTTIPLSHCP